MTDESVVVRASLEDELTAPLRHVKAEVKAVGSEVKKTDLRAVGLSNSLGKMARGALGAARHLGGTLVRGLRSAATAIAAVVTAAAVGIFKLTGMAASAHETVTKFTKVFGANTKQVQSWVDVTNRAYGRSIQSLQDATAKFGVFGKAAGIAAGELPAFSTQLAQAGLDLASFYNTDPTQAFAAITSGLAGQVRPLRQYGIFLSASAVNAQAKLMGLTGTLTDQQKVAVRYQLILKQMGDAQGDLARTSGSLMNKWRSLKGRVHDLGVALGTVFTPIATNVANLLDRKLGRAIERVNKAAPSIGEAFKRGHYADAASQLDTLVGAHGRLYRVLMFVTRWGKRVADIVRVMRVAWQQGGLDGAVRALDKATGAGGRLSKALAWVKQVVRDLWTVWTVDLAPAFVSLGPIVAGLLSPLSLFRGLLHVIAGHASELAPLFVVLVGTWAAYNIATSVGAAVTKAWAVAQGIAKAATYLLTGATQAATVAQVELNTAVEVNPYVLLATAVVAVGLGIWQLWKHSKTARPYIVALGIAIGAMIPGGIFVELIAGLIVAYHKVKWFHNAVDAVGRFFRRVFVGYLRLVAAEFRMVWRATEPVRRLWLAIGKFDFAVLRLAIAGIVFGAKLLWRALEPVRHVVAVIAVASWHGIVAAAGWLADKVRHLWHWLEPVRKVLGAVARWTGGGVIHAFHTLAHWISQAAGHIDHLAHTLSHLSPGGILKGVGGAGGGLLKGLTGGIVGDTPRSHAGHGRARAGHRGRGDIGGNLSRTLGVHRAADAMAPGRRHVTSAYRTWALGSPDSDHRFGRAVDVAGSNLDAYANAVRQMGGFAEKHGSGAAQHVHAAIGDTTRPMSSSGFEGPPGGTLVIMEAGAVVVTNPTSNVDVTKAITAALDKRERDAKERAGGGRRRAR